MISILFILFAFSIFTSFHVYVYYQLVSAFTPSVTWKIAFMVLLFTGETLFFVAEILQRNIMIKALKSIIFSGEVWVGFITMAFFSFLLRHPFKLLFKTVNFDRYSAIVVLIIVIITTILSLINGLSVPVIKKIVLNSKGKIKKPLRIVQLSDLHFTSYTSSKKIAQLVELINAQQPDIIAITGDLLDSDKFPATGLNSLKARLGIYMVCGNHEYYTGIKRVKKLIANLEIKLLANNSINPRNDICMAGINDSDAGHFSHEMPALEKALSKCNKQQYTILLNHRPSMFQQAVSHGVDLQLSGHVHAGQIFPVFPAIYLIYRYAVGLYQYNGSHIYVSPGTGLWGPPMRIYSKNEITVFDIID